MAAFGSRREGAETLVEHRKKFGASKDKLEALLQAPESKLSDAQQRVQDLELTRVTVDQLASKVDKAEKAFIPSVEHLQYNKEKVAE